MIAAKISGSVSKVLLAMALSMPMAHAGLNWWVGGVSNGNTVYGIGTVAFNVDVTSTACHPFPIISNSDATVATFSNATGSYDGTSHNNFTATVLKSGTTTVRVSCSGTNYDIGFVVNKRNLTITGVTASSKTYDGSTAATINTGSASLSGIVSPDVITLSTVGAAGTFASAAAGIGKSVNTSGFTFSGAKASNYNLLQPLLMANITKKPLGVTGLSASDKVYDRSPRFAVTGTPTITGKIGADIVTFNGSTSVLAGLSSEVCRARY